jgi:hypothetical protein
MRLKETLTLHFDLSHCPQDVEFTLRAGDGKHFSLTAYKDAPEKLKQHRQQNKALGSIPSDKIHRITHFVEDAEMFADELSLRSLVYPSTDGHPLPELAIVFIHIPTEHRKRALLEAPPRRAQTPPPLILSRYGVNLESASDELLDEIHLDAGLIKTAAETAKAIIFHHPEIGTLNPDMAANVFEHHIRDTQEFHDLFEYIEKHDSESESEEKWYKKSYVTWTNPDTKQEEVMEANDALEARGGVKINWPRQDNKPDGKPVIPQYELTDKLNANDGGVMRLAEPVIRQVLTTTKNDKTLSGHLWSKRNGTTQRVQTKVDTKQPTLTRRERLGAATKGWTIKDQTSLYGLDLYVDQLKYDASSRKLSFPVRNWPNRYLGAYVEFYKSDGAVINRKDIPGWDDTKTFLDKPIRALFEPSPTKSYVVLISCGTQVFGIPIPYLTSPETLEFLWPQDATKANVLFGGFGAAQGFKDWDPDVDLMGTIATGVINNGTAAFGLIMGTFVTPFVMKWLQSNPQLFGALFQVALVIGINGVIVGLATHETSFGKTVLSTLADKTAGIFVGKVTSSILEKIYKEEVEKFVKGCLGFVSAEEALEQIPFAGWTLKVASIAADVAALAATTVECCLSPATYKLEVLHTMDLKVTVKPDPQTASHNQRPVWPQVSDHFVVSVNYPKGQGQEGGTTYVKTGPMPGKHDDPIELTFADIPAGGKIEVVANIYSENDWLAGRWDSGWIAAKPDTNDHMEVSGRITQNLVPLTPTTTYSQKQRLRYDAKQEKHVWDVTSFSIAADLAGDLDKGKPLSQKLRTAFKDNGHVLPDDKDATITTRVAGSDWELADNATETVYHIVKKDQTLKVQDTSHQAPKIAPDCDSDHKVSERINIIINNNESQIGYTWQATGQNLPKDDDPATQKYNGPLYSFQSVSTLASPEDAIIEPARGFTRQSYLAFDQFGLAPLFELPMDKYKGKLNEGGDVAADIAQEFANYNLPRGARITKVTQDKQWLIGEQGHDPLYDLRVVNKLVDGKQQQVINVYSYPVPTLDNFFLDPRTHADDGLYHLRGVEFKPGKSTFDYSSRKSWGAFTVPNLNAVCVHPHGYVIGLKYGHEKEPPKLHVLRLPEKPLDEKDAPIAMPLSGWGDREGLMSEPVAMTLTTDGRILILEQGNKRIQAFDVRGNPVQCFSGKIKFNLDSKFIKELDSRQVSPELIQAFQMNVAPWPWKTKPASAQDSPDMAAPLFKSGFGSAVGLDNGSVDAVLAQSFEANGSALPSEAGKIKIVTTKRGEVWLVTNTDNRVTYDVRVMVPPRSPKFLYIFYAPALSIEVKAAGQEWIIRDSTNAMSYDVKKTASGLAAQQLISTMAMREQGRERVDYLDIAVENKGYIYVLSSLTENDNKTTYRLDIHNPDGSLLLEKPQTGVNAARLTVDQWRAVFTLNYECFLGPGARTEPGVSLWIPSTPGK